MKPFWNIRVIFVPDASVTNIILIPIAPLIPKYVNILVNIAINRSIHPVAYETMLAYTVVYGRINVAFVR